MFTTLKLFFTSDLGKGVALVALVALGATAVYASGRAAGQVAGYNKGYTEGKNSRQPEVNHLQENVAALTATINAERQATATKVQTLQTNAANAAVATEQSFNKKLRERDQIISNYASKVPPQVQESCGISVETVRAINELIDNVNGDKDEAVGTNTSGTDSPSDNPDGVRMQ